MVAYFGCREGTGDFLVADLRRCFGWVWFASDCWTVTREFRKNTVKVEALIPRRTVAIILRVTQSSFEVLVGVVIPGDCELMTKVTPTERFVVVFVVLVSDSVGCRLYWTVRMRTRSGGAC
jgi:hypothetical protein